MQGHVDVAERWRQFPEGLSPEQIAGMQNKDKELHAFLASSIPEALQHTGAASFDAHLLGVQAVLRNWGAHEDVCRAGE
jgi:hypothetical protein